MEQTKTKVKISTDNGNKKIKTLITTEKQRVPSESVDQPIGKTLFAKNKKADMIKRHIYVAAVIKDLMQWQSVKLSKITISKKDGIV